MRWHVPIIAALVLAACDQLGGTTQSGPGPQLESPPAESTPERTFAPANEAARAATGRLTMTIAQRMPDANGPQPDVLTLRGANGVHVEAALTSTTSPATLVEGQTLRALLSLPVSESQVLVYRVSNETQAQGRGLCGATATAFVVTWEPASPSGNELKALGVSGGAPGASGARACPLLDYRRG